MWRQMARGVGESRAAVVRAEATTSLLKLTSELERYEVETKR